ncbi:hypothetical protein K469DRAFT_727900 [Zopfia rhizophila CBS 207.26]|uniref:AsqO/PenF-like C-terminal domain-containing protein n=1 Tax=Zopfia rhizophila CBS 207.26 TaxID=1314779 RepID=A0A6A6DYY8_9PEZI|nr:hypothetical protein K469DRAFT_727900 [Zopfia rhizophila CBS 207.26]
MRSRSTFLLPWVALAHFPCSLNEPGKSEKLTDVIGWVNAVPDSNAEIDFTFGDYHLNFSGYGYHDKNWGVSTLSTSVGSWYWGRARFGPYSLVFFGLNVRPVRSDFPPTPESPSPSALHLEYTTNEGVFVADFAGPVAWDAGLPQPGWGYTRWAGAVSGGFKGKTTYKGASVWEWIRYLA